MKRRRASPEEDKEAQAVLEETERFNALLAELKKFFGENQKKPQRWEDDEYERRLYGQYQKAKAGRDFPHIPSDLRSKLEDLDQQFCEAARAARSSAAAERGRRRASAASRAGCSKRRS